MHLADSEIYVDSQQKIGVLRGTKPKINHNCVIYLLSGKNIYLQAFSLLYQVDKIIYVFDTSFKSF